MKEVSGADRATHERSLASRLRPSDECHGYEAWRSALVAFYRAEGSFQRAENLSKGWFGLDATDRRTIDALKAALKVAA
jgi:hypothetical protein